MYNDDSNISNQDFLDIIHKQINEEEEKKEVSDQSNSSKDLIKQLNCK